VVVVVAIFVVVVFVVFVIFTIVVAVVVFTSNGFIPFGSSWSWAANDFIFLILTARTASSESTSGEKKKVLVGKIV
jgi:hypothetical protein